MDERGVALGDLTPEVAVDLVRQAPWRCDRKQYAVFVVKRFVEYLAAQGMAKPPAPPTPCTPLIGDPTPPPPLEFRKVPSARWAF